MLWKPKESPIIIHMDFSKLRLDRRKETPEEDLHKLFSEAEENSKLLLLKAYTYEAFCFLKKYIFLIGILIFGFLFLATPLFPKKKFEYPNVSQSKFVALASDPVNLKKYITLDSKKKYVGELKKRPYGICYIHGFLSNPKKIEPIISKLAKKLKANLFFTRLRGHGYKGNTTPLKNAKAQDWIRDTLECFEMARRTGKKSIIIATKVGATLATLVTLNTSYKPEFLILISPNYGFKSKKAFLLKGYLGGFVAKMAFSSYVKPQTKKASQSKEEDSTSNLPVRALKQVALLSAAIQKQDFSQIRSSVLMIYSKKDKILNPHLIESHYSQIKSYKAFITSQSYGSHILEKITDQTNMSENLLSHIYNFIKTQPQSKRDLSHMGHL